MLSTVIRLVHLHILTDESEAVMFLFIFISDLRGNSPFPKRIISDYVWKVKNIRSPFIVPLFCWWPAIAYMRNFGHDFSKKNSRFPSSCSCVGRWLARLLVTCLAHMSFFHFQGIYPAARENGRRSPLLSSKRRRVLNCIFPKWLKKHLSSFWKGNNSASKDRC